MMLRLSRIMEVSLQRPEGYTWELLSAGTLCDEWLDLPDDVAAELRKKYRSSRPAKVVVRLAGSTNTGTTFAGTRVIKRCTNCPK